MSDYKADSCVAVANGSVGKTKSSFLLHKLEAKIQKIMVLRNVDSSLCADTGAVAMLLVNATPVAQGNITKKGSSIQTPAAVGSGDVVTAIIHEVPLHNDIQCIRHGELSVELSECDLV